MPTHIYLWHPIFVHFTLALLCTSAVLFGAARATTAPEWHRRLVCGAELNLWGGVALALGVVGLVGTGMRGGELVYEHGLGVAGSMAADSEVNEHHTHDGNAAPSGHEGHHHGH